jgi:hypothetical protein
MQPLWKVRSGNFAGWRTRDILYDAHGINVGYFNEDIACSNSSRYIGEIYRDDWIGKRLGEAHHSGSCRFGYPDKEAMLMHSLLLNLALSFP